MAIHVLPDDIINKIAAGEVVERPASVVKELVENSIDAGADKIEVSYEEGGSKLIRVRDNGAGILAEDIALVFQRHATSKVDTIDDLEKIGTMGFRGEALASIAAVAKVTLKSRTASDDFGNEVQVVFGEQSDVARAGVPIGTEIVIEDLFTELPARRKFLKSVQTEGTHIDAVMTGFALAYPQIGFELTRGTKNVLHAPAASSIQERLSVVWDESVTQKLREVFYEHPHMTIRGFVGTPQLSSGSAAQWLFVNRRQVEDRAVFAAVREGYAGLLPPKGRPFFVLYLETPLHLVDVNVHPRKKEVRFASNQFVFQAVKEAVKSALNKYDMTPVVEEYANKQIGKSSFAKASEDEYANGEGNLRTSTKKSQRERGFGQVSYIPDSKGMILNDAAFTDVPSAPLPWEEKRDGLQIRFQVLDNVFVFVFGIDSVTVYDQHALHERVLYEQFVTAFRNGAEKGEVQELLIPQKIKLSPERFALFEQHAETLRTVGFSFSILDDREIEVTAVPVILKNVSMQALLPDVLDEWGTIDQMTPEQDIRLATMACRAAVKAGDPLSESEIRMLLEQVAILDEKYTCPHGRPFKVIIPRKEIDGWFKRTGF